MTVPRRLKRKSGVALAALVLVLVVGGQAGAQTPGAPTIDSVTAGAGSLVVAWSAPGDHGGSTISAYNLRHIETEEDETVDANWTVESGVWMTGGGSLEYTLTGLDGEISYEVQVQAVNDEGGGEWSATSVQTPGVGTAVIDSVSVGDGALTVSWSGPPHAARANVESYDLRYIETSADETVDANWTSVVSVWTGGPLHYVLAGLTNGTGYDVQVRAVTSTTGSWSTLSSGTPAEHGGALAGATDLTPGTPLGGSIDPGADVDYFKFVLTESTGILIFTEGDLDTVGELQNSDGALIKENNNGNSSSGPSNFLIWDSLSAGAYYIKVTGHEEATGAYVLLTHLIGDSSSADRHSISLGDHFNGLIDPAGDRDSYTFTLAEETKVLIRRSTNVDVEIRDSNSNTVGAFASGVFTHYGLVYLGDLQAGTYRIDVEGTTHVTEGLYSVWMLEHTEEPADTLDTAVALQPFRVAAGEVDPTTDVDYLRIDLDERFHPRVRAVGDGVDIAGELLDIHGVPVTGGLAVEKRFGGGSALGFELTYDLGAGTYYLKVTRHSKSSGSKTGFYVVFMSEDTVYAGLVDRCTGITLDDSTVTVDDPWYGCQWHLHNEGQRGATAGEDINIEEAWSATRGAGVNVSVVGYGIQHNHPDLAANVDSSRNHDFTGRGDIYRQEQDHDTKVAGIIAARDNSIGVRGVAPNATIYASNFLFNQSARNEYVSMLLYSDDTAVSNNGWGPVDGPIPATAFALWEEAVQVGVTEGFGGKGIFYVFAAGNGAREGDYSTIDEYVNHYAVTAVCAVNAHGRRAEYSERGANLWLCAPSSDATRNGPGIATTTNRGRYTDNSSGTSAAASQVSGVAALVRSVDRGDKPALSWRDVKLILAASARKNHADDSGWETGADKYGSDADDEEHYHYNHSYGFGVVDAKAAVDLAADWETVRPMRTAGPVTNSTRLAVPKAGSRVSGSVVVSSVIDFIEFVEINTDFDARAFRNLQLELVSPSGKVSVLSVPKGGRCTGCSLTKPFRFGTARHLGEDPSGTWTLRMQDTINRGWVPYLNSWSLTVYGHSYRPGPPTLNHVAPSTDQLTVSWNVPDDTGTSAITGYDVRYIRSDSTSKSSDSAWTVVSGAGGATDTTYTIDMLDDGVRRDVQVRAVNGSGGGDWSVTARGTPGATNSEPFFADGESTVRTVEETDTVDTLIGLPVGARDAESDTLTYTLGGAAGSTFTIDGSGQLKVKDPLDFEGDVTSYEVEIKVRDGKDNEGNADTADDASISVTVMIEDVDEPPEMKGNTEINYRESRTGVVARYTAVDPEGEGVEWDFSGADQSAFTFDNGRIDFVSPPDYEDPADQDGGNDYEVVITLSDGEQSRAVPVTVNVTDVNEPFTLEGDTALTYEEGGTGPITTFTVVDDPENGPIDWDVTFADRGDFTIEDGVLSFAAVPDYESPADSGGNNTYNIRVHADDGANRRNLPVTVTVTDVDEDGELSLSAVQPQEGIAVTATLDEPDRIVAGPTWAWHSSSDGNPPWTQITGAGSRSYTPMAGDVGNYLRATATYADTHRADVVASAVARNPVQEAPVVNTAPYFPTTEDGRRSVAENTVADTTIDRSFGTPVGAIDDEGDPLTYALGGTHAAWFDLDIDSGQLRTKRTLDHESRSGYSVRVTATDPSNLSASINVTVTVTNEEETGTVAFSTEFPTVGRPLAADLTDPDGGETPVEWEWRRSDTEFGSGTLIDGADTSTYTPVAQDIGAHLRAIVTYTDRHQPQLRETAESTTIGTVSDQVRPPAASPPPQSGGGGGGGGGDGEVGVEVSPPAASELFADVEAGVWYESAVSWMILHDVTSGCAASLFCPDAHLTRQQFVTFLWRAAGRPAAPYLGSEAFSDVRRGVYAEQSIGWAVANGVTRGCTPGEYGDPGWRFCPEQSVTRGQMATLLYRHTEADYVGRVPSHLDVSVDDFFAVSVSWLTDFGVAPGCGPGLFCPSRDATRAEAAVFINGVAVRPHIWGEGNTSFIPQSQ